MVMDRFELVGTPRLHIESYWHIVSLRHLNAFFDTCSVAILSCTLRWKHSTGFNFGLEVMHTAF